MKRSLLLTAGLAATLASAAAFAQGTAPAPEHPKLNDVKARITARLQTEITCVQAANSFEQLRACRPHPEGRGRPDGPKEPGEQR